MKTRKPKCEMEDVYTKPSDGKTYHRCLVCWVYGDNKLQDNGFTEIVEGKNYNHVEDCTYRDLF